LSGIDAYTFATSLLQAHAALMINNQLSTDIIFPRPFMLLPGDKNVAFRLKNIWLVATIAAIVISVLFLFYLSRLTIIQVAMIGALELLISVNVYFFFLRRKNAPGNYSLEIDLDEIRLYCDDKILQRDQLKNLKLDQLVWGEKQKINLPLVRLAGESFPEIFLAAPQTEGFEARAKKFRRAADFLIVNESEWQRLMQILAKSPYFRNSNSISDFNNSNSISDFNNSNSINNENFTNQELK
jgi:hypothetical protein